MSPHSLLGLILGWSGARLTMMEARGQGLVAELELDGVLFRVHLDPLSDRRRAERRIAAGDRRLLDALERTP